MTRLLRDAAGAAAVEFALLAPAFFAFVFLVIEGGRMIWTHQVLQQDAFVVARCMGLKAAGCTTDAAVRALVVSTAARSGVRLAQTSVTPNASATCSGRTGMSQVRIVAPYANVVGSVLPRAPAAFTITACFPNT